MMGPTVSPGDAERKSWVASLHSGPHGIPFQLRMLIATSEFSVNTASAAVVTDIVMTPGWHDQ
jgi:hypothetical protein